jgi:hypothetical protein
VAIAMTAIRVRMAKAETGTPKMVFFIEFPFSEKEKPAQGRFGW